MCNVSVVFADSNAPTECRVSINNNALYTNNRYVTLELYGTDADPMQVWISNDGENGTVLDFAYNKTISITDINYTVGVTLDSSNSTTSTNSDNVLRIENWPLSSVNGTKKVYAVFRDAYGNKTSVNGLSTITITYNLNGGSGSKPANVTTVKNLGIYINTTESSTINQSFTGWSDSTTATLPNYSTGSISAFDTDTTLYAIYKTIVPGDYVYYSIDLTKTSYQATASIAGTAQTFTISDKFSSSPVLFRVLSANSSTIILCPNTLAQTFSLALYGANGYNNGKSAITSVCALYSTKYSSSTSCITQAQKASHTMTVGLSSLFGNWFWITSGWEKYNPSST